MSKCWHLKLSKKRSTTDHVFFPKTCKRHCKRNAFFYAGLLCDYHQYNDFINYLNGRVSLSSPDKYQHKLGKGMIVFAWLLLLGILTMLFSNYLDHQQFPNQALESTVTNDGHQVVTLKMNRSGHYLAPGAINQLPVTFLLDTGATDVAVPERLAEKINLKKGAPTLSQTANGIVRSYATVLDRISIGGIEMYDIKATILPGMPGGEVLLGMSFLKHLEMVQKGNTLTLKK